MSDLAAEDCVPCRGGVAPMAAEDAAALLSRLPRWRLAEQPMRIERGWRFPDFAQALAFVQQVSRLAEEAGHHPDIAFGWGYAAISLHTHAIGGLHRNDFILAARIDAATRPEGDATP